MATPHRQNALHHVVVVIFENRSFDHPSGRLYQAGEVRSFEPQLLQPLGNGSPEDTEMTGDKSFLARLMSLTDAPNSDFAIVSP
jgi:phospholipase C